MLQYCGQREQCETGTACSAQSMHSTVLLSCNGNSTHEQRVSAMRDCTEMLVLALGQEEHSLASVNVAHSILPFIGVWVCGATMLW